MKKSLTQKNGSVTYTIEDAGLIKTINSKGGDSELHYPFEQLKTNKVYVLEHNKALLLLACIFAGCALLVFIVSLSDKTVEPIAAPLWLSISLILFAVYFKLRARKLYLQTSEKVPVEFIANKPCKEAVNEFIEMLLEERNSYLLSKYGQPNRNLEYAPQLDNLNWLLNNRVISKEQYDKKVKELNSLFNSNLSSNQIGSINYN